MRDRARPSLLAVVFLAAIAAWIAAGFGTTPVSAEDTGVRQATSVCEAHELREEAAAFEDKISALVSGDPELSEYVRLLKKREFAQ